MKDCGYVGRHKVFVVAQADYQRRSVARSHDLVGLIDRDHTQGKHATEFFHGTAHSFFQRRTISIPGLEMLFNQVRNHFSIGFCREGVAFFDQLFLQAEIVFDDPVMHDHDLAGAIAVRMSVFFGRTPVGSPASVANAVGAVERLEANDFFQIAQFAFGASKLQLVAITGDGNSSRIITAVFEPPQALDDDRNHFFFADVANNATHEGTPGIQSAREQRNSSITGFVSTSRAMRSTSLCASSRLRPPSSVSSKYFPWRTSSRPLYPIFFSAP